MKKLSSFKEQGSSEKTSVPSTAAESGDIAGIAQGYRGKSESELMTELKRLTAEMKAEGKFDPAAMQQGMNTIMPMLNDEQRRRLADIVGRL